MLRDIRGVTFDATIPPRRVVSLVPSITETLFDLGAGGSVVGITDFCIFPPNLPIPRLGGTKNPAVDEIRALQPDLVHMNLEENLERHARAIEAFAPLFVTEPKSVSDVASLLTTLGTLHGTADSAARLLVDLERSRVPPPRSFSFACAIWKGPWMWAGGDTYVSALIEECGGVNVVAEQRRYPVIGLDEVVALRPDLVFLPDEPYRFTTEEARSVVAAGARRVCGPFPGHLVTWHGSRTILGLQFVRQAVQTAFEAR